MEVPFPHFSGYTIALPDAEPNSSIGRDLMAYSSLEQTLDFFFNDALNNCVSVNFQV